MELRRKASTYSLNAMEESNIKIKPAVEEDWTDNPDYEFFSDTETLESDKVYDEVMEEIENLPSPYKDVLQDREIRKLKYEEIAEKRGIKINTVRSRIHVAKKLVKNKWIQKKQESNGNNEIHIKHVGIIRPNKDDAVL
jgi:RNA polymerase sigma factor (sigma-70 family)